MRRPARVPRPARVGLAAVALLAACASTPVPEADELHHGHGSGAPGTPHPSVPPGADGSVELEDDFVLGGPGLSVTQALEAASGQPVLLTGVLLRDPDGGIWFCDRMATADPPDCGRPRLWVVTASELPVFAPENAAGTGARTADGTTWVPDQQVFGIVHPRR